MNGTVSAEPTLTSKSLILIKVWCLLLVFISTFICGVSPYFMKWNQGFVVLGTWFGGGVFLGMALMGFLSDSSESFAHLTTNEYPFAFMLAGAGYVFTMFADCVVLYVCSKHRSRDGGGNGVVIGGGAHPRKSISYVGTSQSQLEVDRGSNHYLDPSFVTARSFGDIVLLIIALCFHSVFEGMAIGVADTKANAWRALWIVVLHKAFAAIVMGITLLRMIPDRPLLSCLAYAFAFSISSPVGIVIGIVIDANVQGIVADWIYTILMGFVCGVFIYVSVNHLLYNGYSPERIVSVDTPHHKFLAVFLGFGLIAVVMIWDT